MRLIVLVMVGVLAQVAAFGEDAEETSAGLAVPVFVRYTVTLRHSE